MTMSWMIAAFLSAASPGPPALQPAPTGRFIVCPGNRRCPRRTGFSLGAIAGATIMRGPVAMAPSDRIGFETGSATLDRAARAALDARAAWLAARPAARIMIEGHADEAGDREAARALAHRRAAAAAAYLEAHGVAAERIMTILWASLPPRLAPLDRAWREDREAVVRIAPE